MPVLTSNTAQPYPCTNCGEKSNVSIVREAKNLTEKRVKCNRCNFMYFAADSLAAVEEGALPDGPPELQDPTPESEPGDVVRHEQVVAAELSRVVAGSSPVLPRSPAYVLLSRDRTEVEFATKREFKAKLLKWTAAEKKFDVYQLDPKKVSAKVDVL